jgi:ATP-binding cassette, subfamily B, bacterial
MQTILQLTDLSFSYPNSNKLVLTNINIEFIEGRSYALIGPTGEGKSTLAMLISGLLKPTSGKVITKKNLKIGYILQDSFLFEGTILDNLVYGNTNYMQGFLWSDQARTDLGVKGTVDKVNLELLQRDLETRGFLQLLDMFDDGLNTKVGNQNTSLSLGQKQIINFLRVILTDPELLIMDEATANLDTVTEQKLQKILDNLPTKTTKIIIAHRLNTVKNVDYRYIVNAHLVKEVY